MLLLHASIAIVLTTTASLLLSFVVLSSLQVELPQPGVTDAELKLKIAQAELDLQFKTNAFVTEFKTAAVVAVSANVKAGLAALRFALLSHLTVRYRIRVSRDALVRLQRQKVNMGS